MINIPPLEKRLPNQPIVSKRVAPPDARRAVVAHFGKRQCLWQDVEVAPAKREADVWRRTTLVVPRDAVLRAHRLDSRLLEKMAHLLRGTKDDGRSGVGDEFDVGPDRLAVEGECARDGPFAVDGDGGQRAREEVGGDGAVVQLAGPVGLEGESEAAGREGSLVSLVAEAVDEGRCAECASAVCVADEAVAREGRRRCWLSDVA